MQTKSGGKAILWFEELPDKWRFFRRVLEGGDFSAELLTYHVHVCVCLCVWVCVCVLGLDFVVHSRFFNPVMGEYIHSHSSKDTLYLSFVSPAYVVIINTLFLVLYTLIVSIHCGKH